MTSLHASIRAMYLSRLLVILYWKKLLGYNRAHMKKQVYELPIAIIKQMLLLATGGFSLVAALAWNEVIKNFIDTFVKPYVSQGSGVIALLIYAIAITVVAVFITYELSSILEKLEEKKEEAEKK